VAASTRRSEPDSPKGRVGGWLTALWHGIYPGKLWEFLLFGTLAVLVGWLWYWAFSTPPKIIIEDIAIPKQLQDDGFSGHFLAGRIADEIRNIQHVARTTKFPISTGTSESAPDIEVRATVFTLGSIMSFVRETLGTGDHIVTASLYCGHPGRLSLSLQGSYSHRGQFPEDVAHVHILDQTITVIDNSICTDDLAEGVAEGHKQKEQVADVCRYPDRSAGPSDQTKQPTVSKPNISGNESQRNTTQQKTTLADLPKCAARAIIKTFDPFFLAAYHYERAKYYRGVELLAAEKLLTEDPEANSHRATETTKGFELIKYCLGLDTPDEVDDRPDERNIPYDKHTRVRALNLWGLFDVLDVGPPPKDPQTAEDKKFEQAENRFAEAVQLAGSDPRLKQELAFVYANWAAVDYAWHGMRQQLVANKPDPKTHAFEIAKNAIRNSDAGEGYEVEGEILLDPREDHYDAAGRKLAASVKDHRGAEDQDEAETIKELGDTLRRTPAATPNQVEKAIKLYRRAIDADASLASPYIGLSRALQKLKEPDLIKDLAEPRDTLCRARLLYSAYPDELPDVALFRPAEFAELTAVSPEKIPSICDSQPPAGSKSRR
jgi:hypothetical protein